MKVLCFQRSSDSRVHLYISCRKLHEILKKLVNFEKKDYYLMYEIVSKQPISIGKILRFFMSMD